MRETKPKKTESPNIKTLDFVMHFNDIWTKGATPSQTTVLDANDVIPLHVLKFFPEVNFMTITGSLLVRLRELRTRSAADL
jgi:hypothetical protein